MNIDQTQNLKIAQHDALSDIFVAPLGRISGLRAQMTGISAETLTFALSKDHDRSALMQDILNFWNNLKDHAEFSNIEATNILERNSDGSIHYQIVVMGNRALSTKEVLLYVRFNDAGRNRENTIRLAAFHSSALKMTEPLLEPYKPTKGFVITRLDVIGENVDLTEMNVDPKEAVLYPEFYPFIEEGPARLINDFYDSDANLMIFTGIQGSGKSTLFRGMLNFNLDGKFYLMDNPDIYRNPDKLAKVMKLLCQEAQDSQVTVAIEEVDAFLKEKDEGNNFLPRLLSLSAGVIPSNIKFVPMSNIPTAGQLNEALTRDGRTFRTIDFPMLTPEEAEAARAAYGLPPMGFTKPQVLGTVLHARKANPAPKRRVVGFTG